MTPGELRQALAARPLLLDGGLGSLLIAMGLEAGGAPYAWNLERPAEVTAVHRRYVEAGSDVIHANTFGATAPKLAASGLGGRCREVNERAVALARAACARHTLVAGDVGPTGKLFAPMGDAREGELEQVFGEQIEALAAAGVDLISIETMYDLREAVIATRAACASGLAVIASMTFERKPRGFFTLVGNRVGAALQALAEAGAQAVGANCSLGPEDMLPLVGEARAAVSAPLVVQPNAGRPRLGPAGTVYDAEPEPFAAAAMALVAAGVRLVGGCCGTSPAFISAMRRALDTLGET